MRLALLGLVGLSATFAGMPQTRVQPATPASVSGYILETTTGKPIGGAEVIAVYAGSPITSKSDLDGHFQLDNIPPATYRLTVSKDGYVLASGPRLGEWRLILTAGEKRTDLVLRMLGSGTVSGRVLDSNGRPVVQGRVRVFRFAYHELQREPSGVQVISERNTDDRGEFRVFNIPSGLYFVLAQLPPSPSTNGAVLYPGERELGRAQGIEVRAEEETRLRDLTIPPPLRGSVRLHVVNATGGPLPPDISRRITAVPSGWDVLNTSSTIGLIADGPVSTRPGDREVFPGLLGSYVFYTAMQTGVGSVAGYAKVDYSGADVDVDFVVGKLDGEIKGRVLVETAEGSTRPLPGAEMEFYGVSAESNFSDKDGVFNIRGLLNGPYQFSGAFEMPKGYYVTSVRERDRERDVLKEGLMVSAATPEVEVRVRADAGALEGNVADSRRRVVSDAVVALVPQSLLQNRTDRHNTYRVARSAASGAFALQDIVPGEYLVYAWSDLPEGAVMDPWFMERYKGKGMPVRVEPGGRLKTDLRILDD